VLAQHFQSALAGLDWESFEALALEEGIEQAALGSVIIDD
jgi:hypothetical protein